MIPPAIGLFLCKRASDRFLHICGMLYLEIQRNKPRFLEHNMKYTSKLIAEKDKAKSKRFYRDVLGLNVVADFGANVTLDGGVVL